MKPEFVPQNINITFNILTLNNDKSVKYLDLYNTETGFIELKLEDELDGLEIKDAAVFQGKLYVLTTETILVFNLN